MEELQEAINKATGSKRVNTIFLIVIEPPLANQKPEKVKELLRITINL
jgi:hypothetical protein